MMNPSHHSMIYKQQPQQQRTLQQPLGGQQQYMPIHQQKQSNPGMSGSAPGLAMPQMGGMMHGAPSQHQPGPSYPISGMQQLQYHQNRPLLAHQQLPAGATITIPQQQSSQIPLQSQGPPSGMTASGGIGSNQQRNIQQPQQVGLIVSQTFIPATINVPQQGLLSNPQMHQQQQQQQSSSQSHFAPPNQIVNPGQSMVSIGGSGGFISNTMGPMASSHGSSQQPIRLIPVGLSPAGANVIAGGEGGSGGGLTASNSEGHVPMGIGQLGQQTGVSTIGSTNLSETSHEPPDETVAFKSSAVGPGFSDESALSTEEILSRKRLDELVQEVDPHEQLDDDVKDVLLNIADDFIEQVVSAAARMAKHRRGDTLEARDVQMVLAKNYNMYVPGFGNGELRPYKKASVTEAHKQRLALIKKTIKKL